MNSFAFPQSSLPSRGGLGWGASKAFTLAEVLITLVIIGIIAAITIPAISRSSEKYILKNQFKKAYSTIYNAMQKADRDLGGDTLCYYSGQTGYSNQRSECPKFFEQMLANMSIQKRCDGNAKRDGCIPTPYMKEYYFDEGNTEGFGQNRIENVNLIVNLADGTIISAYYASANMPAFMVDVNGAKGPNEWGKDIFALYIYKKPDTGLYFRDIISLTGKGYFRRLSDIYKE